MFNVRFCSYFQGTFQARASLGKGNYTEFNLLLQEITDPKHAPRNYFMEACKYVTTTLAK